MKIAKRTPTQLLVKDYPIKAWGLGGICCGVGLYSFWPKGTVEGVLMSPDSLGVGLAVSSLLLGVGLFLLLRSRVLGCCFDQDTGALTLTHRSLLKTEVATFPLADIIKVKLETAQLGRQPHPPLEPTPPKSPTIAYRVVLILASNQPLPLTNQYSEDREGQRKVAQAIAEFLNIEADLPPAFSDLIKSIGNAIQSFLRDR